MRRLKTVSKALTRSQRCAVEELLPDVTRVMAAEVNRRLWARPYADDILQDAATRTFAAVAKNKLKGKERIVSRSRSCALDAMRTQARRLAKPLQFEPVENLWVQVDHHSCQQCSTDGAMRTRKSTEVWAAMDEATGQLIAVSYGWEPVALGRKRVFSVTHVSNARPLSRSSFINVSN